MPATRNKLTPKQRLFVGEYLVDLNATRAAKAAGYSEATAYSQGQRLLKDVEVASAIEQAMARREKRTEITADRVLQELSRLAFFDVRKLYRGDGSMKAPHELDDDCAAAVSSLETFEVFAGVGDERQAIGETKKFKLFSKDSALTLAMRHLGMLKDKVEHSGDVTIRGKTVAELQEEIAEIDRTLAKHVGA